MSTSAPTTLTMRSPTVSRPVGYAWERGPMHLIHTTPSALAGGAKDQYTSVASDTALVHNCIIRALNSIYLQAPHVPISEYRNFVAYCLAAYAGLSAQHSTTHNFFFPELERLTGEQGLMNGGNDAQLRAFERGFAAWGNWLKSVDARRNNFSQDMCRSMMEDFMAPLNAQLHEQVRGGLSKTAQLPVFSVNHDATYEGGLHSCPVPMSWTQRIVFGRRNSEWWKFGTCGFDGRPRASKFMGEAGR
ncbi:hypothetical protein BDV95DRAFT_508236 [Massariosphaeria phaeospora]|uniref:Hemerythrin-like domain-containing protein n=1 Tax=Massariosphaeria phaeospora TaxID=100035 RepID=A0A7C8HYC5_9PLEO|nr:hypothetical protein BDV95DRAFT_508236 [Massariosphaeria phaeospora]